MWAALMVLYSYFYKNKKCTKSYGLSTFRGVCISVVILENKTGELESVA